MKLIPPELAQTEGSVKRQDLFIMLRSFISAKGPTAQSQDDFLSNLYFVLQEGENVASDFMTREEIAFCLAEVSRYYGKTVDAMFYPYDDEASPEYVDALAYCSLYHFFDVQENHVRPESSVTYAEMAQCLLTLFVALLE